MNQNRFQKWMNAVDDDLLEEAQRPQKKKRAWVYRLSAVAACLAVGVAAFALLNRPAKEQITNPVHASSAQELQELGYSIPLSQSAQNLSYSLIDSGSDSAKMAEVNFEQDGQALSCRALKASQPQDISGIYDTWTESLDWSGEDVSVQLRQSDSSAWVGWYAPDVGVQWCVSGGNDAQQLLSTAQGIIENLGYTMPLYPLESAQDAVADGGYAASFEAGDLVKTAGGYELTAQIYDFDRYELDAIEQLKEGGVIQVCRTPVTIETIERKDGVVLLNGGRDAGGVELIEEDGLYRTNDESGQPLYYALGELTLPLSEDCTFADQLPDEIVYEFDALSEALAQSAEAFTCYNTVLTVRQEQIVQILRYQLS